jgi:DNA-binding NtrC family response regulator
MSTSNLIPAGRTRQPALDPRGRDSIADAARSVLLGESMATRHLRSQIQRIAPYFRIALIRGESGAGKQQVARTLHASSPAVDGPFVVVRASELATDLDGSAPPRAAESLLRKAEGGTLYLKCIGELTFAQQSVLLRFLLNSWERRTMPSHLGRRRIDRRDPHLAEIRNAGTRILVASDRDLRTLSSIGQFRQDLYAQIAAVEILVPPLRQRVEDIPALAISLLNRLAEQRGEISKGFSAEALLHLKQRSWPNNLRELECVVAQAAVLAEGGLIEPLHLCELPESAPSAATNAPPPADRLHDVVQRHVLDVLTRCNGNKLRAAEMLGISRSTLYRMLGSTSDSISALLR